jgi:phosphoribosyl 1,2-cyclic phosphodiesterase
VEVALWGTRGSLASPGPETVRYGGNTSCVEVRDSRGTVLALDAGTGIRRMGDSLLSEDCRVDVLLTHLHMDHIQGLGFFAPLYQEGREVHIWGPQSPTMPIQDRLARYLSPPLFPVRLRDLPCKLTLHDVPLGEFMVGELCVKARLVSHPGHTVGYRIAENGVSMAYIPDHEPALGWPNFPGPAEWISGLELARGVDLLIHDAQYTNEEYEAHVGWGHSSLEQAMAFAEVAGAARLMTFHHDPEHSDAQLDRMIERARNGHSRGFEVIAGTEGLRLTIESRKPQRRTAIA